MGASLIAEAFVVLDGARTRVLQVDGEGAPILLLHGFTDSADSWRPVLRALAHHSRRAVAVDLPGSGKADPVPRERVMEAFSRFVDAFVEQYAGADGAVLAGNSLGGLLALRAAEQDEAPLRAIVPIAPAGLGYVARARLLEGATLALTPLLRLTYRTPVPASIVRAGAEWFYRTQIPGADRELPALYAGHFRGMRDLRRFGRIARCIGDEMRADPLCLDRIRAPVLLIWGDRDPICDVHGADALLDVVPGSRLVVLDDCGHCPQMQRPEAVARLFLDLPGSSQPGRALRASRRR
jgi:pimeloyl-ACP methyl ester carboxylesterase